VTQQPPLHRFPGQQGLALPVGPGVPHTWHSCEALQSVFGAVHVLFAQHGAPAEPQATQTWVELLHAVPASRQAGPPVVELVQQGCPVPPHSLHEYVPVVLL
jgi:hypothetical protein